MNVLTRILRTIPVLHPATVRRLLDLNHIPDDKRAPLVCALMAEAWAEIHQRDANAHDLLAWCRKQVPLDWAIRILRIPPEHLPGIWEEIDGWVARGVIDAVPDPVDDPGESADYIQRQRLLKSMRGASVSKR